MALHRLIVVDTTATEALMAHLAGQFEVTCCAPEDIKDIPDLTSCRLIVIGPNLGTLDSLSLLASIKSESALRDIPVVFVAADDDLQHKVSAFEQGAEDYLNVDTPRDEFVARMNRAIMHRIANIQLQSQLQMAHEVAMVAMNDTSDLGINMHFLLDANRCNNFDELGQRLLQATRQYGLKCSLQIRGRFEEKNMELNGMPKDLETQLLHHLKDQGRLVPFGKRLVVNYDQVSLLVKNMPVEDERRCGTLKDNLFYLVQGCDARVKALDDAHALASEMRLLMTLTERIERTLSTVDEAYQQLTNEIVAEVERLAEEVDIRILTLDLTEEQEETLSAMLKETVERTNAAFNRGLRVDQSTRDLIQQLQQILTDTSPTRRARMLEQIIRKLEEDPLAARH